MSDTESGVDVSAIIAHGQAASEKEPSPNTNIEQRLEKLELAIEQVGQQSQLVIDLQEYIAKLSAETTQLSRIRMAVLTASAIFLLWLNCILFALVFLRTAYFFFIGPSTRVAIITSVVAGSIFLLTIVIKGVFRTLGDRHTEDKLPPHLQAVLDIAKSTFKPGA